MNARETAVVRSFVELTPEEKIRVYLEIEEVWKGLQAVPTDVTKTPPVSRRTERNVSTTLIHRGSEFRLGS
jgi:hypothetical protein